MKKDAAAKKYAKALIEIGQDENRYREIGKELRNISAVFADNPELKRFAINPMYKLEDRQGLVEKVADTIEISPLVKKFLSVLVETRGIGIVEDISSSYSKMEDELSDRVKVTIESAIDLDEGRLKEIQKRLHEITRKEVAIVIEKNQALIGGLVFKIGNTIFDGSIKNQLQRVKEKIIQGVI
ncbi:MAG: ATP synthase F1 subunit delta [Deltaproteobacteria bacterium]|nr:ATP synthase F1 subunit delta [Deltaproteobacteria bacterium]